MKTYNQAPLPFQGQKRKFLKHFKEALKEFPSNAIYIDLFGGSGLLSQTVKSVYLDARVVWNDFDNYTKRLSNINKTNKLLADLRIIIRNHPNGKRIIGELRELILERLAQEKGFIDWITLSSSLLFSAKYITNFDELLKQTLYNNIKQSNYNAEGYLDGVERVQMDYKELFNIYKGIENVVFLIDPPYLSTDTTTYTNMDYWRLADYLDILKMLEYRSYFYFTSEKSQLIELAQWFSENSFKKNPFEEATTKVVQTSLNYSAKYKDIMIFKTRKIH